MAGEILIFDAAASNIDGTDPGCSPRGEAPVRLRVGLTRGVGGASVLAEPPPGGHRRTG